MEMRYNIAVLVFSIVAVFFVFSALMIHPFGDPGSPEMDNHIIRNTQTEAGTNNGVTSVVFDYRGFDTLGEATILFTAVAGVMMIFRRKKK
ncbi:MAG: hydrogen gas-evolving membrane-bound hydrogenase subunit E [Thermoplasmatota archaeon]|jgi:multisubunit Na+/H+ antiporter MnhB subunit